MLRWSSSSICDASVCPGTGPASFAFLSQGRAADASGTPSVGSMVETSLRGTEICVADWLVPCAERRTDGKAPIATNNSLMTFLKFIPYLRFDLLRRLLLRHHRRSDRMPEWQFDPRFEVFRLYLWLAFR